MVYPCIHLLCGKYYFGLSYGQKGNLFESCLLVFNETFAETGAMADHEPDYMMFWHERTLDAPA